MNNLSGQKILIFNWKDIKHPQAGGAEIVTHEIAKRMVLNNNQVTMICPKFKGGLSYELIDGIEIHRTGGRYTHYPLAILLYRQKFRNHFDYIIEEVNTIPYFLKFFKGKEKLIYLYMMLCRVIWFYQMIFPLNLFGYLAEIIYTNIQSWGNYPMLTISNSSKEDLKRFGFKDKNISIFSMGIETKPLSNISDSLKKEPKFTVLFHSSLREMKRPLEAIKAFAIFFENNPNSQMWISGDGELKEKCQNFAKKSNLPVTFFGRTNTEKKLELMQKSHVLISTSIKEGWGLIVTEANSMATPAIAYDVDGLRDSAGYPGNYVVDSQPRALASQIDNLARTVKSEPEKYNQLRQTALDSVKKITYEQGYEDFIKVFKS